MSGSLLRLLVCFVVLPGLVALVALFQQFYVTYVQHERLYMDLGLVAGRGVLALIPGLILYLILLLVAVAMKNK
jgi:hypothetical protein